MTAVNITTEQLLYCTLNYIGTCLFMTIIHKVCSFCRCSGVSFWASGSTFFLDICGLKFLISQELFQKVAMKVFMFRFFVAMKLAKQVKVAIKSCELSSL